MEGDLMFECDLDGWMAEIGLLKYAARIKQVYEFNQLSLLLA